MRHTDHAGLGLARAAALWEAAIARKMSENNVPWYSATGALALAAIPEDGIAQAALVARLGVTKQAVQQTLTALERHGAIARKPDPENRRGKRVEVTSTGRTALAVLDRARADIESSLRADLGPARFARFEGDLVALEAALARLP